VFAGKQSHKEFVYGIMTTRGINDGSPHYGIRSIRSENYKLIWNLTPEMKFVNRCTTATEFKSWLALAATGHADAIAKTSRYQKRPKFELYDIQKDPLEMNNLAGNPTLTKIQKDLYRGLRAWMKSCNDLGKATEMAALEHMARNQKKKKNTPYSSPARKKE
jgi:uncharacterized sulfatase